MIDAYGRTWKQDGVEWISGGLRIGGLSGDRLLAAMNALYPGTPPAKTADEKEKDALNALLGISDAIDRDKLLQAIVVNFTARSLGKPIAQLTATEIQNEKSRIAMIYRNL